MGLLWRNRHRNRKPDILSGVRRPPPSSPEVCKELPVGLFVEVLGYENSRVCGIGNGGNFRIRAELWSASADPQLLL